MQYFHWSIIFALCFCICLSGISFAFCCSANALISFSTRKRTNFDPRAWAYALVDRFHGEIGIVVLAFVLASLVKTRL